MSMTTNQTATSLNVLARLVLFSLFLCLFIILWGAWVRISFSGDGCGNHWPLCHNEIIPDFTHKSVWIEYTHRLTSGIYGILIFYIFLKSLKYSKTKVKKYARLTFIFTLTEALVGALLVKKGLVGDNDTIYRVYVMVLHQINSMLLVGSSALLYLNCRHFNFHQQSVNLSKHFYILFIFVLLSCTGVVASLSTTLYPADSLLSGIQQDLSVESHFLVKLRSLHPLMGLSIGFMMIYLSQRISSQNITNLNLNNSCRALATTIWTQIAIGLITILSLSPVPLKLIHLAMAHILWISFCYVYFHSRYKSEKV